MPSTLLSLLLAMQMLFSSVVSPARPEPDQLYLPTPDQPQVHRLWWGMLDPELSTWFTHIPMEEHDLEHPILWNWSWRGFLAALFGQPMLKEAGTDVPSI